MWDGMFQMSLTNNHLVERHKSLPEINELDEWKEKERMFERRNSFTTIPNTKKKAKQRRRCQRSESTRSVDSGYITQTILNEQIAWSQEEVNFSSSIEKTTAVNRKKKTISLRNSIQALLDANDNLVTDSYKTLSDAEEWNKCHNNGAMSQSDMKGLFGGKSGSLSMLEQIGKCVSQSDDMMSSLLRQTTYSSVDEHESEMLEYSYTIDAEMSYQEYNKLMQIIIMILQEKKKWEEYIKEAEEKLMNTANEKSELANNNKVLKESLETANDAINDINSKVQKLQESLVQLREENNSLRKENKEVKDKMKAIEAEARSEAKENGEEASSSKKELVEYKRSMHEKFNKLEEAYRSYRKEMETKHADMNSTLEEIKQQHDNATFNIEELKSENLTLTDESDLLVANNEQLTAKVKEKQGQVDDLASKNETLTADVKERQVTLDTLTAKIETLIAEMDEIKKEGNTLAVKNKKLTTEIKDAKADVDTLAVKNEKLTAEIKEQQEEANKKRIRENNEIQLRNQRARETEENNKKQLQEKKEEIEKQKWEVFFFKEEAASLEKENNQLKTNTGELENKVKDVESKREALEKEADQEMKQNRLLKGEVEDMKKELDELTELKRKSIEVNMEVEIYKRQASTHQLLRDELESLKRDNLAQISENEKLKAQVEKLKIEATASPTPQSRPEIFTKRLLKEMENLRKQLRVLDGNQDTAAADCVETKGELEKLRKELNSFLEGMREENKEKHAKTIKEDINELKLQMSELEYLSRSKSMNNSRKDSTTSSTTSGSRKSSEYNDYNTMTENEHIDAEVQKFKNSKIHLVIDDDVVKWIDAPNESPDEQETKLGVNDSTKSEDSNNRTDAEKLEICDHSQMNFCANINTNYHPSEEKDIEEDENEVDILLKSVEPFVESVNGIRNGEPEETEVLSLSKHTHVCDDTNAYPRVEIVKRMRGPDNNSGGSGGESQSEQRVEIVIRSPSWNESADSTKIKNFEKHSSIQEVPEAPSLKDGASLTHDMNIDTDDSDPFNHVSSNHQLHVESKTQEDHIYAEVTTKKLMAQQGTKAPAPQLRNCNTLRGRTTSAYITKKGLSRTNTYLCSDYRHVNKGRECDVDVRSSKVVDQVVDGRRGQARVHRLKANSTECFQNASRASPVTTKLSRTIASLNSHENISNISNQKGNRTSTEGEWKPALPVRNTSLRLMSKKKPNELFQDQSTRPMIKEEEDGVCVDGRMAYSRHDSRHDSARLPPSVRKPVTLKRAQSVKVKGEELYATIRKRTEDETKEKFIERMNSINDVERSQIERMESARKKLTGKALQEEVTSRNNTIKKKSLQSKSTSNPPAITTQNINPTASITIHGIPVRRNARRNSDYDNELTESTSRRHSADMTAEKKPTSKLRRAASLHKKSAVAGEFKHLKDGIKSQLMKSKGYSQKTLEFFTEEATKKYKYAKETLKSKNFCLKPEKMATSPLRRNKNGGNYSAAQSHCDEVMKEIRDMTTSYEPFTPNPDPFKAKPNERSSSVESGYSTGPPKREAIYENTNGGYKNTNKGGSDPALPKRNSTSPNNRFSLSDADLTSLSHDDGATGDQMSWEHYYPVETTPKNSLLSLV